MYFWETKLIDICIHTSSHSPKMKLCISGERYVCRLHFLSLFSIRIMNSNQFQISRTLERLLIHHAHAHNAISSYVDGYTKEIATLATF